MCGNAFLKARDRCQPMTRQGTGTEDDDLCQPMTRQVTGTEDDDFYCVACFRRPGGARRGRGHEAEPGYPLTRSHDRSSQLSAQPR
jgi:hypothetical protein